MTYLSSTFRGSLVVVGVAFGVIGTAGTAAAQDAPPASEEAVIGDALSVERPAPRPDPGHELRADGSPDGAAPAPAPVPAPADPATSGGPATQRPAAIAGGAAAAPAPAAAASAPVRPTEVQGVQVGRPGLRAAAPGERLAFTGVDNTGLTVSAVVLLAMGTALIRIGRPRPVV